MNTGKPLMIAVLLAAMAAAIFAQSEDDFDVLQLRDNTLQITKYKGNAADVVIPDTLYGLKVTVIGRILSSTPETQVTSIVIPDTVTEIANDAFSYSSLTKIVLGKNIARIGEKAFYQCEKLSEVDIPDSVTEIGEDAFNGCSLSRLKLGKGLKIIQSLAFNKNKLTALDLPASLKEIGNGAFADNSITSLVIPNGVTLIGNGAFRGNPLESLVLPASVTKRTINADGEFQGILEAFNKSGKSLVRISLPDGMNDSILEDNFESGLINCWKNQNRAGGVYVKKGPVWTRE